MASPGAALSCRPMFVRRRLWLIRLLAVPIGFVVITVGLFVIPPTGKAPHADAVVLFDEGTGIRLATAVHLVETGAAPVLVISYGPNRPQDCLTGPANVQVVCFSPDPDSTQGEARQIAALAIEHHWSSLIFVTDTAHVFRARFRLERCFDGKLIAMTSHLTPREWVFRLGYEWVATAKALLVQRNC